MIYAEIALAVITVVVTVLPARGVIRRNHFVGVRTRATMRDDESWIRGHRAATLPTVVAAVLAAAFGAVCLVVGLMNNLVAILVCAGILVAGALWAAAAAQRALR